MNADAFRHLYAYHFAQNRHLWDAYIMPLSDALFVQPSPYSVGSVCDQVVHLVQVDHAWFGDLTGGEVLAALPPDAWQQRDIIRTQWDRVEAMMQAYLATLRDEMLQEKPFAEGEDKDLILWQILLHVVNHGTDHRAQLLRQLHDFGVQTTAQDYIFYAYDHPITK